MPPNQQNPYEFILNPETNRRSGPAFLQDPFMRKIVLVLFIAVIVVIGIIFFSVLFGGDGGAQDLNTLAAQQTEINRIAAIGLENGKSPEVLQLSTTTLAVIRTDLSATTAYLSGSGVKLTPAQLAARSDPKTTTTLTAAQQRNTFDDEFLPILEQLFATYKQDIQASINKGGGPKKQQLLESVASNVLLLSPNR